MANKTAKFGLNQFEGTDKPTWMQDYNDDMSAIETLGMDKPTYDPTNVGGDAFRASNQKMTGYAKASSYTAITSTDTALSAIAKLEPSIASAGDMRKDVYDTNNNGKVDSAEVADTANSVAWGNVTSRPNSIPNPNPLTLKLNGTNATTYTGSESAEVDITASLVGAASLIGGKVPASQLDIVDSTTSTEKTKMASANSVRVAKSEMASDLSDYGVLVTTRFEEILANLAAPGAGAHNSIYRGKFLGNAVTSEQYAAIASGDFTDLYIGDYWTISGVNYRIAAFNYYLRCGDTDLTTPHVVIVPDASLYSAAMNDTNITTGGYVGSEMYTTGLAQAKTTIKAAFPNHVLKHRQYLVNAVTDGKPSGGGWFDSEVELMSEITAYGCGVYAPSSDGTSFVVKATIGKNQLPVFAFNPSLLSCRAAFWLRDVANATSFALVGAQSNAAMTGASASLGVRPAFSIF